MPIHNTKRTTYAIESPYTFVFECSYETVYGSAEPCGSIQYLRLEPDFGEVKRVLEHLGNHACNLCACYDRRSFEYVNTHTPKGDVLDRTYSGRDSVCVVGHDAAGQGRELVVVVVVVVEVDAGVLLHF